MKNNIPLRNPLTYILLFVLFGISVSFSQENQNCTLVGTWADGPCYTAYLQNEIVLLANGAFLEIVDISDPANPVELSKYQTSSFIYSLTVEENYAYIANQNVGLLILDITDLSDPVEVGFVEIAGFYSQVAFHRDYIYFTTNATISMRIIDVSNPEEPVEVSSLEVYSRSKMTFQGDYMYLAARYEGFQVYSIADPIHPVLIAEIDSIYCSHIDVNGDYAYVSVYDSLMILDITTPADPIQVGVIYPNFSSFNTCIVEGNTAYIGKGNKLTIADVSDPELPVILTEFQNFRGFVYDIVVSDTIVLLVSGASGINIVNVSDHSVPKSIGYFDTAGNSQAIAVRDSFAYLANNGHGIRVFSISNPENPYPVGIFESLNTVYKIVLDGDNAFLADLRDGLIILDVRDPSNPVERSRLGFETGTTYDINIQGDLAYVAQGVGGMRVIDVSDPENPTETGFYDTEGRVYGIDVIGDYAYIADWDGGLRIIDITNPVIPFEVGFLDDIGTIRSVIVAGDYAYVGLSNPDVKIIDISDPAHPFEVSSHFTARAYHVELSDHFLYVSAGYNGLIILDVSDPADPQEVGYFSTGGEVYDAFLYEDNIYLADYSTGMTIVKFDETTGIDDDPLGKAQKDLFLNTVYPNPFREFTSISYGSKYNERMILTVRDISGRVIKRLADKKFTSGNNFTTWDGTDHNGNRVSAGQYFIELKNKTCIVARPVVFID